MLPDHGVVLDTSALVAYARSDLRSLPIDELLREMREDTDAPVIIPKLALNEARWVLGDEKAAIERLDSFADAHGVEGCTDPSLQASVRLLVSESGVSQGMAHAMLLAVMARSELATYSAPTLRAAGFEMRKVLDLDEFFRE